MGHWDVAKTHSIEAERADPQSAEARDDLALVLDNTGDHAEETDHFKHAHEHCKSNVEIHHSESLMRHLKMYAGQCWQPAHAILVGCQRKPIAINSCRRSL